MSEVIEQHKLTTYLDKATNKIIKQDKWIKRPINQKEKGFNLVYLSNLKEILNELSSPKHAYILLDLLECEMNKDFILKISYKTIADIYGISESMSRKLITTLKNLDVIRPFKAGSYLVNPFLVLPKVSDDSITLAQVTWNRKI